MKWEIKDKWIHREYPNNERFPELESSLYFFREWAGIYWARDLFIRTNNDSMSKKLRPMIEAAFNQAHNNKTFRNHKLYHGRLIDLKISTVPRVHNKYLILARNRILCTKCRKLIDPTNPVSFRAFDGQASYTSRPSYWGRYNLRCYCSTCRKIEKLIE